MKVNVSNMPLNTLYKFGDNSFVWSTMLNETRSGNYPDKEQRKFTEVFRVDGGGGLSRVASGRLVDNPSLNDYDHRFSIFDYDQDLMISFFVTEPLKEADLKDLYKLQAAIAKEYEARNTK